MGGKSDTGDDSAKTVVVLGGGLSGLSAARRLLDHGYHVTLVEKRPFLGGRAFSFHDPEVQWEVDNGQHVFMGCCTYFIDFLKSVGAEDKAYLQERLRTEIYRNGKKGVLGSTRFLGPLHLLPSFISYPHLGLKDKLLAVYGLLRIKLTDRAKHARELDEQTAYHWLKSHHQSERAINNLWNLILLPTLNDNVRDVSADMALMVFQEGMLGRPADAAIGFSRVGLTSLAGEPARAVLEERGSDLVLGKTVRYLDVEDGRVKGVEISDGRILEADAYVSALPFDVLLQVLREDVANSPFFSTAKHLTSSPIVGIHLWYDRPVMDQDFVGFLDSPVQWVFNKSAIQGGDGSGGQYLCISLSGAWEFVEKPKGELGALFVEEMKALFPKARDARIERILVVKQPQATFRSVPGAARHRLPQKTPIRNLFLAGEWTDTGWPSTMEGATRSGVLAADALASRP